jgi:hypothetical protein
MASDPPGGKDDLESRKTRFVPRSDIVEGEAPSVNRLASGGGQPASPAEETPSAGTPGGTIIGRTRLVGDHGQTALAAGGPTGTPAPQASPQATMKMGVAPVTAKTEYIRNSSDFQADPVAGWVVVVKGPGRGGFCPVFVGMNSIGRDKSQRVSLDFGDDSISREQHAFITYDEEQRRFYLQHGGKSNLVRLGDQPVMMPTELQPNDVIRIGKTTLRFFPCCGPDFSWSDEVADA